MCINQSIMWSHAEMLKAAYKVIKVIKSCETRTHFKSCQKLINNFHDLFRSQKNANQMIVRSYTEHLLNIYQKHFTAILY